MLISAPVVASPTDPVAALVAAATSAPSAVAAAPVTAPVAAPVAAAPSALAPVAAPVSAALAARQRVKTRGRKKAAARAFHVRSPREYNPQRSNSVVSRIEAYQDALENAKRVLMENPMTHSPKRSTRATGRRTRCTCCDRKHDGRVCPAAGQYCYLCNDEGHFATGCQSRRSHY
ncbi:eukaryotic translation initiation factor 3 subunit F-like [Uranotaenia lowii]|uniref:eukaryotic translation initiation factor 3 subunit F-like n=1 Tax=Uranotaenia lowii TaxID=190385 RepID=UPI002478BD23|nr:eukaryotic translation initiation factor 3 subunit F-like [Uranotaenia lowii]